MATSRKESAIIEKTAEFAAKIGDTFIDTLRQKFKHEPLYKFLFPESPDYQKFLDRIAHYKHALPPGKIFSYFRGPKASIRIEKTQELHPEKDLRSPGKNQSKKAEPEPEKASPAGRPKRRFRDEDISVGVMATMLLKQQNTESVSFLPNICEEKRTSAGAT